MKNYLPLIAALLLVSGSTGAQPAVAKSLAKVIICLTYDDGLDSHISTVLPQLDSLKLKGTFFLNAIRGSSNSIGEPSKELVAWTHAAKSGHELANHTLFHACPSSLGFPKEFSVDDYTVEKILEEIKTQNSFLAIIDPNRKTRSFAFPCNNVYVAKTDYSKVILENGLVKFGRIGGDKNSVVADFKNLNPMQVPSWLVQEGTTLEELVAFAKKVKANGGLGIYQFHGVGGEFFKISSETHFAFLSYLKKNEDLYLVTTFSEAMKIALNP